ncbi:MAG TPA: nucleotide exchange factor GrpE [Ignavibacteria bacterium]|nr:nucleotide exchange factor GrpE [Ignavibacteria bacterium]
MSDKKKQSAEKQNQEEMKKDETKIEIERETNSQQSLENEVEEKLEHIDEYESRIEELTTENERLRDQLLRKAAEFENYKRRTEIETSNFLKYAGEFVVTKMLPVYDDLRRSLEHVDSKNSESFKKGIELVYEKFTRVLKEIGVSKIEAKGKEFDFNLHEALMQKEVTDIPPHTVIEEIDPGYMYKDKVIRHTKVIVSQASSASAEEKSETQKDNNE